MEIPVRRDLARMRKGRRHRVVAGISLGRVTVLLGKEIGGVLEIGDWLCPRSHNRKPRTGYGLFPILIQVSRHIPLSPLSPYLLIQ